ncbi:MAG: O-antigen ligase family protein [Bacteroidales bacterium]|nr:O-antigen ligase family protein [Bacteroidales bacterium]
MLFIIGIEIIALILLKSRTAFLGVCVVAFCLFLKNFYKNKKIIVLSGICIVLICILVIPKLYNFKKDSADGRFFIWKVATEMITDKPLGYGYGTIVNCYNKAQSTYIQTHTTTKQEQNTAEFTYNLMNDYLEMSVMGGVAGGILYLTFVVSVLYLGLKYWKRDFYTFIGVLVFAVMGLMNFAFFAPQVVLLFAYYAAISAKNAKVFCEIKATLNIFLVFGLAFLFVACGYIYVRFKINYAYELLENNHITEAKIKLQKTKLFTSNEIYYRCLGDCYFAEKDFAYSLNYYSKAVEYAYQPKTLIKMANCEFHFQNYEQALKYLHSASNVQPVLFEPHYCEMIVYLKSGKFEKAKDKAIFILQKEIKLQNKKIDFYQEQASKVLKITELQ